MHTAIGEIGALLWIVRPGAAHTAMAHVGRRDDEAGLIDHGAIVGSADMDIGHAAQSAAAGL